MGRKVIEKDFSWFISRGVRTSSGCLEWPGKRDKNGYGINSTREVEFKVHRRVFALRFGEEPEAVRHMCDNPPCFEPTHLIAGTRADNNRDMAERGRGRSRAKLTYAQAMEIKRRRLAGEHLKPLSEAFGISLSTVCDIAKGRSWTNHIPHSPF